MVTVTKCINDVYCSTNNMLNGIINCKQISKKPYTDDSQSSLSQKKILRFKTAVVFFCNGSFFSTPLFGHIPFSKYFILVLAHSVFGINHFIQQMKSILVMVISYFFVNKRRSMKHINLDTQRLSLVSYANILSR